MPKAVPSAPVKSLTESRPTVLALGVDPQCLRAVRILYPFAVITELSHGATSSEFGQDLNHYSAYLFGNASDENAAGNGGGAGLNEIVYRLKQLGGRAPYYYVASGWKNYDRRLLLNLGLDDTFYLPLDLRLFEVALREALLGPTARRLRPVRTADLLPEIPLDFDVYVHFPLNCHYLKLVQAGDAISARQLNRLKKHQFGSVFLPSAQMGAFDRYARARRLTATRGDREATEQVRIFFGRLISSLSGGTTLERARPLVNDLQEIVKKHVLARDTRTLTSEGVVAALVPSTGPYEHALNVAILACFLAGQTGIGDPEELAAAALLHDIGLGEVSLDIHLTPPGERTLEQQQAYAQHPMLAVDLMKRKRIVLENVFNLLQRHHEPRTPGPVAFPAAQLLIIADQLDELRPEELGKRRLTPAGALAVIREAQPEFLAMAVEIFSEKKARKAQSA